MQRNDSLAVLFILSQAHRLACFRCEPTILNGKRPLSLAMIRKIKTELGISADTLIH